MSTRPTLSNNAIRRQWNTTNIRQEKELCSDDRVRLVTRARFDIGRYLDRSKYRGDGTRKS